MKVIVVGGGASGLFAASHCAENENEVTILEKNDRLGKKLLITGKGRCNVTNNCDQRVLLSNVVSNPKFLYHSFFAFSSEDTMRFFENHSVPLKTERGNRVFPCSDKSVDIVDALKKSCDKCQIIYNAEVKKLIVENNKVIGVALKNGKNMYADAVIIATGGKSYPKTGSTGEGYKLAQSVGHTIIEPQPSLVPIECNEKWCQKLMGLSLKNVSVSFFEKEKCVYKEQGEMLFTHFGISGPVVLSASSRIKDVKNTKIYIDMKPALSYEQLDARMLRDFEKYKNKDLKNALVDLLPQSMIEPFIDICSLNGEIKINQLTKAMREKIVSTLKEIPLTAKGFRPLDEAIITRGGVCVKEIDPKTMQSKLCKGLYFAGEVIDVDAFTGGFNLQIAFSTAYVAANNIKENEI